jgi:uncharacterized protein involved in response to NO
LAGRFLTRDYLRLALAIGLLAGFGLGTGAFLALLLRLPVGSWWAATAQAHGHAQLFGFAGLMVFGVAFIFLPRLRGAPLWGTRYVPWVLALYGGGVVLRLVTQIAAPPVSAFGATSVVLFVSLLLALSGPLTLAGAVLGVTLLVQTARHGPPLAARAGLQQVLPLVVVAWVGLLLALAVNTWGTLSVLGAWHVPVGTRVGIVRAAPWLVAPWPDALTIHLALLGWLAPMAIAFAARSFPLFLWTQVAPGQWLRWGLVLLSSGLILETLGGIGAAGNTAGSIGVIELGRLLVAGGLLWLTAVVGALGPKSPPAGRAGPAGQARGAGNASHMELEEIARWPLMESFVWLTIAGGLILFQALLPALGITPPPEDAVRHALGTGFVLLLVVGMALHLVPGFAAGAEGGRRTVDLRAARVATWAAQAAAVLRVAPLLANWLLSSTNVVESTRTPTLILFALAGVAGAVSLGALCWALRAPLDVFRQADSA